MVKYFVKPFTSAIDFFKKKPPLDDEKLTVIISFIIYVCVV
jgi:hypothetical protein